MKDDDVTLAANLKALEWYEDSADYYASLCVDSPTEREKERLHVLARIAGEGGTILEVGSGPGADADYLDTLGVHVRRTDATAAFVEMQRARGKDVGQLNIITDDFGGPYQGVLALCVLLHIAKDLHDEVLAKVAGSLAPGGAFLVSVRASQGGDGRDIVWWHRDDFVERLERAGLRVEWEDFHVDTGDDEWLSFVAVKD